MLKMNLARIPDLVRVPACEFFVRVISRGRGKGREVGGRWRLSGCTGGEPRPMEDKAMNYQKSIVQSLYVREGRSLSFKGFEYRASTRMHASLVGSWVARDQKVWQISICEMEPAASVFSLRLRLVTFSTQPVVSLYHSTR